MLDIFANPTPEMEEMLVKAGSVDRKESFVYGEEIAKALTTPLRQGVLSGDILDGIFKPIRLKPGAEPRFPLDFLAPGTEKEFVAFTVPNAGRIPDRFVEGDWVTIPAYDIAGSIGMLTKYARDARWDVVDAAANNLRMQFVKKMNDDGFHTLLAAGVDRNVVVYDDSANAGQFTKRLVSLAKTVMRRNGGGNSTSVNRGKLTDLYISPEMNEDMRNWNIDQVDEITRREIYLAADGTLNRVFGVNLHDLDELGEGQEYQLYFTGELAGTLPSGDSEIMVGLDLSKNDSFVMPIVEDLQVNYDDSMLRSRVMSWWATMSLGFGALDSRRVILLSA